ncbi:methylenetetrahydrofolate dehydrogenase-like protein [Leptotrombidium deliense]|uniref:Methylenetetrahydrofolate dehydrogenase-like protein n=1 Tax=Leptotrombidium deliense TaxID=299467 RepID=A0A443SKG5_9ACAR|nr:methylenetetrahydrofolate dehydrogenase-like protein [Leptotrombidium deliense]
MECKTILAADVASSFRDALKQKISERKIKAKLVGYLANKDPSAEKYAEWTARSCKETGVLFELRKVNREDLEETLLAANDDDEIHGIMVYYPVFGGGHDQYLQNIVSPYKDVEGLCHTYRFNMYHNIRSLDKAKTLKCIIPCTPLAIIKILEYMRVYDQERPYGNQLFGKTITIINRSEVVGRPLAALLANDGATIYSIDIHDVLLFKKDIVKQKHVSSDCDMKLEQILPISDVVISGVPTADYRVPTNLLKEGVVAITFSSFKNFEENVKEKASMICASVGKATVTMLQRNFLRLREYQMKNPNLPELRSY